MDQRALRNRITLTTGARSARVLSLVASGGRVRPGAGLCLSLPHAVRGLSWKLWTLGRLGHLQVPGLSSDRLAGPRGWASLGELCAAGRPPPPHPTLRLQSVLSSREEAATQLGTGQLAVTLSWEPAGYGTRDTQASAEAIRCTGLPGSRGPRLRLFLGFALVLRAPLRQGGRSHPAWLCGATSRLPQSDVVASLAPCPVALCCFPGT